MRLYILTFLFSFLFISCDNQDNGAIIPFVPVYEQIDYNSIINKELWNTGGYKEINDAGYKGLIIYRESSNNFRVFDQACSYDPLESCSKVVVDESGLFLIDKCCNSTFNFSGIPTGGPAFKPLLEYNTHIEGNFLIVSNN